MTEKKIDLDNLPITWSDPKAPPINLHVMSQWSDVLKYRQLKEENMSTNEKNAIKNVAGLLHDHVKEAK